MRNNPMVSAIIPTYNRGNVVCEAIDSVLQQNYPHLEVIVVDDGSKDETQEKLKAYGNKIRVVTQENAGPAVARNRGIAVSRGDLIAFLDSDDLWLPSKLERQVALLQRAGESVPCCLCNIMMRWLDREIASFDVAWLNPPVEEGVWLNVDEVLATRFVLFNQAIVIRREVLERIGGFDESLRFYEDYDLPLRLSLEGPWAFVREPLVIWRQTKGSLISEVPEKTVQLAGMMVQVLERQLTKVKDGPQYASLRIILSRELKRARRHLRLARMGQTGSWHASSISKSLRRIEQYRSAIFRRSPLFPKMKTEAVR